jgi:hydrogenase maturation protein HypF
MSAVAGTAVRARVRVEGTVQGVGYRPFVYRLAGELGLSGWVLNDVHGVLLEAEGESDAVESLVRRLSEDAPPLAVVERVDSTGCPPTGERGFAIRASEAPARDAVLDAPVSPDTSICEACRRELLDPRDRRYRYPFINCTDCGPRFTIVRGVPYDRPLTTMAGFTMCDACRDEYEDPGDRRFHAQPNACPACGPSVALIAAGGSPLPASAGADMISVAAGSLAAGAILAIKGIGGYHLACRADDEAVVARLRARKHREDKPFALMVETVASAARYVSLSPREDELLRSAARPIVLAPRSAGAPVGRSVASGAPELGVMLPYAPLHVLLLGDLAAQGISAIVLTSGNVSDEPIAFRDEDALDRLAGIADAFLVHNRPIETRTDDSVVRVVRGRTTVLRRSRGYVPGSLRLPRAARRPILACGAELKHTFCLARGERAWVSHHIGDLQNYETLRSFADGVAHFERLFDVAPALVAHDLHPDYLSTRYALERDNVETIAVQHHHAHLAACLAEHGEDGPAVAAVFDGTGYGLDGTVWGGEILFGDAARFERAGHLLPVPMPGGERAIREPWRMACAWLDVSLDGDPAPIAGCDARAWGQVLALGRGGLNSPLTSSAGRLFDAIAALCGLRTVVNYEGQAAIELEAACDPGERGAYPVEVTGACELDPRPALRAALADVRRGVSAGTVASRFHAGLGAGVVEACTRAASDRGVGLVVLTGGVFQNRRLLTLCADGLERAGLRVLAPSALPAGDGGVAFGQAAVAAARS